MNEDILLIKQILDRTEGMDSGTFNRLCKTLDTLWDASFECNKFDCKGVCVEILDEDLFEDGELKKVEVLQKIEYHLFVKGDWKLIKIK